MNFHIGWPQLIWIGLAVAGVIHEICHHGKIKTRIHDGPLYFVVAIIHGLILYWGGFFK